MKHGWFVLSTIVFLLILFVSGVSSSAAPTETVTVTFINVGQGESVLIRDGSGFDALIDGGKSSAGPTVVAYLRGQGVDDIEVMVATHANSDHIGGLINVLELDDIPVELVLYNGYPGNTVTWSNFVTAVANEGLTLTTAQYPQNLTWGSTSVQILNPISGLVDPDQNDASVVILLDHTNTEFLFTGDISTSVETDILSRASFVEAEILKVSHHGSKYASSSDFLTAVQPKDAVISVGSNPYGHPTDETISRLQTAGAQIWRTDTNGNVLVISDGETYSVVPQFGDIDFFYRDYLPLVIGSPPEPEPTATPTSPPPPPPPEVIVEITDIFYDGVVPRVESDEYAEITNLGDGEVNVHGWRLNAGDPGQDFIFPDFVIQPGQACRVYTNEYHPDYCGFSFGSSTAIWNNSGDCGYLYNESNELVSTYCY